MSTTQLSLQTRQLMLQTLKGEIETLKAINRENELVILRYETDIANLEFVDELDNASANTNGTTASTEEHKLESQDEESQEPQELYSVYATKKPTRTRSNEPAASLKDPAVNKLPGKYSTDWSLAKKVKFVLDKTPKEEYTQPQILSLLTKHEPSITKTKVIKGLSAILSQNVGKLWDRIDTGQRGKSTYKSIA